MMRTTTPAIDSAPTAVGKAFEEVSASFERFCLAAGVETLVAMMERDAEEACGPRYSRHETWELFRILKRRACSDATDLGHGKTSTPLQTDILQSFTTSTAK